MSPFVSRIRNFVATNRGLGYVSIGNIAGNVIGSVFWIILAAFATTEIYGKAGYFTTVASFSATVALFGLPIFLTSFLAKGLADARHEVATMTLIVSIAAAIGAFVIFHYLPLSLLILGVCFFSVSMSELVGQGRYREYAIYSIGQKSANIAISLMLYFSMGIDGIMLGYAISYIAFSHTMVSYFRRAHFVFSFPILSAKRKFLAHSWGLDLSKAIGYSSDKFLIAPLFGYTTLGIYQLGVQFLLMESAIPNVIFTYVLREESLGISRRYVKIIGLAVTAGISMLVTLLAPYAVPTFFPKFTAAITMIQIAIWGGPMMTLNSIIQSELLAKEKSGPVVISGILFFAVMYASMYYLGNVFGLIGLVCGLIFAFLSESIFLIIARAASKEI